MEPEFVFVECEGTFIRVRVEYSLGMRYGYIFQATPEGLKKLRAMFRRLNVREVACSSSVDFSKQIPNARRMVEEALSW